LVEPGDGHRTAPWRAGDIFASRLQPVTRRWRPGRRRIANPSPTGTPPQPPPWRRWPLFDPFVLSEGPSAARAAVEGRPTPTVRAAGPAVSGPSTPCSLTLALRSGRTV